MNNKCRGTQKVFTSSFINTLHTSSVSYSHRASTGSSFWGVSLRYFRGTTCRLRFWRALTRSSKWFMALAWSYIHRYKHTVKYILEGGSQWLESGDVSMYRQRKTHIQLLNQTLHLIHIFKLWVVLLANIFIQPLQQVLSVTSLLVELHTQTHTHTDTHTETNELYIWKCVFECAWVLNCRVCLTLWYSSICLRWFSSQMSRFKYSFQSAWTASVWAWQTIMYVGISKSSNTCIYGLFVTLNLKVCAACLCLDLTQRNNSSSVVMVTMMVSGQSTVTTFSSHAPTLSYILLPPTSPSWVHGWSFTAMTFFPGWSEAISFSPSSFSLVTVASLDSRHLLMKFCWGETDVLS